MGGNQTSKVSGRAVALAALQTTAILVMLIGNAMSDRVHASGVGDRREALRAAREDLRQRMLGVGRQAGVAARRVRIGLTKR